MKKYVPSGYQIINLGDVDLSNNPLYIPKETNEDTKILFDLLKINGATKPILLHLLDISSSLEISGVCVRCGNTISLTTPTDDGSEKYFLQIGTTGTDLVINLLSESF